MKKIGILTFHRAHNCGALLQAFALQEFLKKDYNPFFLDYYSKYVYNQYKILKPLGKNPIKIPFRLYTNLKFYNLHKQKYYNYTRFIEQNLNIHPLSFYKTCDSIIVGSDQVWNPNITGGVDKFYTLSFFKGKINKISYAASFGNKNYLLENKNKFKLKLSDFDFISVREEDSKVPLENIINKNVDVVLDPTLLLSKEKWDEYLDKKIVNEKYVLAYNIEPNKRYINLVNYVAKEKKCKIIYFDKENIGYKYPLFSAYSFDPFDFINLIKNAEYIVTTSFHATVFSIIFNKQFWVIPHAQTGARVINLLSQFNLNYRIIKNDNFEHIFLDEVNYKMVNKQLELERKKSADWLKNSLK